MYDATRLVSGRGRAARSLLLGLAFAGLVAPAGCGGDAEPAVDAAVPAADASTPKADAAASKDAPPAGGDAVVGAFLVTLTPPTASAEGRTSLTGKVSDG